MLGEVRVRPNLFAASQTLASRNESQGNATQRESKVYHQNECDLYHVPRVIYEIKLYVSVTMRRLVDS